MNKPLPKEALPLKRILTSQLFGDLKWPEAKKLARENVVVLLPLGSIEQHGPHLPLDTDSVTAYGVCTRIANQTEGVLVMPPVYYTPAEVSIEFSGTVDIKPTHFIDYLYDICESLVKHGFRRLVMVSGHGINPPFMNIVSQMVTNRHPALCAGVAYFDFARERVGKIVEHGSHACEFETSVMLALKPESVEMTKAVRDMDIYMGLDRSNWIWRDFINRSPIFFIDRLDRFSKTGVIGDPTKATKSKGERVLAAIVEDMAAFVAEFKRRKLPSAEAPR